jgi:hypothetical protein
MEICNSSVATPLEKCRRRHELLRAEGVCLHAEMENLPAATQFVSGLTNPYVPRRKTLLQHFHYGHILHHAGDFRVDLITGYA